MPRCFIPKNASAGIKDGLPAPSIDPTQEAEDCDWLEG
jgi:hypothetical protein